MKLIQAFGALVLLVALAGWGPRPRPTYVFYKIDGTEAAFLSHSKDCWSRDARFNAALTTASFVGRENVYYRCMRARGYATQSLTDAEREEVAKLPSRDDVVSWVRARRLLLSAPSSPQTANQPALKPQIIE